MSCVRVSSDGEDLGSKLPRRFMCAVIRLPVKFVSTAYVAVMRGHLIIVVA